MKTKHKVLAIGAHPDDLEISCAGTLAKLVNGGALVTMVIVTDGELSSPTKELKTRIERVRINEFYGAAEVINAAALRLRIPDGFVFDNRENRQRFIKLMLQVKPDTVITHYPDNHPDHRAVNRLVCASVVIAQAQSHSLEKWRVRKVYLMEPLGGLGFEPDAYVDITPTLSIKKKMLLKHMSQLEVMKRTYGIELWDTVETTARFRGMQSNVSYAEAFQEFKSRERTRPLHEA